MNGFEIVLNISIGAVFMIFMGILGILFSGLAFLLGEFWKEKLGFQSNAWKWICGCLSVSALLFIAYEIGVLISG